MKTSVSPRGESWKRCWALVLVGAGLAGLGGGCATTPREDDPESNIPWNAPQPWEGSIVPGFINNR